MTDCEKRIDLFCNRIKAQQEDISNKRKKATLLRLKADLLRREADLNCLPGKVEHELLGMSRHSKLRSYYKKQKKICKKQLN